MKRLSRIFALLMAASMLIWMIGCGGDDDDDDNNNNNNDAGPVPTVDSTIPAAGTSQAGNSTVTFNLNKQLAEASVSGAAGATAIAGNSVVFTPSPAIPEGSVTLTLTGKDASGQEVSSTLTFTVLVADTTAPAIADASCVPANGATGVDPAAHPDGLTIAFSEALSSATITGKDPDFAGTDALSADGTKVDIAFLQYSLPNETVFTINLTIEDAAGNTADVVYTFVTVEKAE
jgi:hypothetical protein